MVFMTQSSAELAALGFKELRAVAKEAGLPANGGKEELIARLIAGPPEQSKSPVPATFEPGEMKCHICDAQADVIATSKEPMSDGRILVTRTMRCRGRHRHRWPHKQTRAAK